jgi:hypothetical protein
MPTFLSVLIFLKLIIRYVLLNTIEIIIIIIIIFVIIPKPNIFARTRTQNSFTVCGLSSCNLLAETNNFVLYAVLLSCLFSELQKPSSPGLEPRTVLRFVALVPVISSPKQTILFFTPFFYRAYFLSYRNRLHRDSNPGQFSGMWLLFL